MRVETVMVIVALPFQDASLVLLLLVVVELA